MDLSVIIVTWNRPHLLRTCLHSLRRATANSGLTSQVWVVDNGSTAGDAELVENEFPEVNLLRSPANVGFARANNLALRKAESRYYLLVNNDVLVPPEAIASMIAFMDASPHVGVAGAALVDPEGRPERSCGDIPTLGSALADQLHLSILLSRMRPSRRRAEEGNRAIPEPRQVGYVCGAFLLIRRETIQHIGLLDGRFDFYYEEVDWCARAWAAGWQVVSLPAIRVMHRHGGTTKSRAARFHAQGLESRRRFLEKYCGRIASFAYRAAVPVGALLLMLRSLLPGGSALRSRRLALVASGICWALRGHYSWPP